MSLPPTLAPGERSALREFVASARALLGTSLLDVRLFGSRARGEGHQYSDLDVALIVDATGRARRYDIYDLAFDIGLAHSVELAPLVIDRDRLDELKARERRIARVLEEEGIPL